MAQYQHLPIYKQTYDILLRTMTAIKDSSKRSPLTPTLSPKGRGGRTLKPRP